MIIFLKKNYPLIIGVSIIFALFVTLACFFYKEFIHSVFSLVSVFNSLVYYFKSIFQIETGSSLPYTSFDYIMDLKEGLVTTPPFVEDTIISLPDNSTSTLEYLQLSWFVFWNIDYFLFSIHKITDVFIYLNLVIFLIVSLTISFSIIRSFYLDDKDPNIVGFTSRRLNFNKLSLKYFFPIKQVLGNVHKVFVENRIYTYSLLIVLYFLGIINVTLDLIAYLFIFSGQFHFEILFKAIYSTVYCLFPTLSKIPLTIYLIIFYLIFDKVRCHNALNRMMMLDYKNRDFIDNKTGVINIVKGAPGVGKTLLLTDLGRSTEQLFRYKLLDIMNKYSAYFPNFDFKNFEEYIKYLKINNICNNQSQLEDLIRDRERRFYRLLINNLASYKNLKAYLFGYDFMNEKMKYRNGLYWISFFDFLITYGQAYFYYVSSTPLIYSNYSIRLDSMMIRLDYFPSWIYDYFTINKNDIDIRTKYSHIIDMDSLRLGKKFNKETPILGFGVLCFTEFDKERGNQLSNVKYKKDDFSPNPTNDELTKYLKLSRQVATIDYQPFFKMFTDLQRTGDLSLGNVEISECVIKIKSKVKKTSLRMFWLEPLICYCLINFLNKFKVNYRSSRNYYSLFYAFIVSVLTPFKTYLERRENIYGFSKLDLEINVGDDESDISTSSYYLFNKKAYAKAYSTDTHYGFFKNSLNKERTNIDDKPSYSSLRSSSDEIKQQNSFLGNDLEKAFNKEEDSGGFEI